ncbi:MAG: PAS domain S-box protein, partial [Candidatus Thorarchaeota archaeon]
MTKQIPDLASSAVDRLQMRKHAKAILLPVVELDLEYNIIYANKPAMDLLALDEAALEKGVHSDDLVSSEQVSMIHGGLSELAKGAKPTPMSLRIVRSDNVQVLTQVFTQNVFHRGKHVGFVVFAVDLSRRESIEDGFREKEEIFELIVEHSSIAGNIIVDDNFILEYVNDKLCDMVGRRRSELLGHDFKEFLHPDSIELVVDRYKKRLAGEDVPTDYEFKILKKDGTPRDFLVSSKVMASRGGPVKTIAQLLDITEETERKRALEQSERRNRMLVEAMHSGFCISDEETKVVLVNESLCRMLGYSSIDELVGKSITTLVHGWSQANAQEKIEERKKGKTARYELTLKGKLGEKVPAIVSAAPLFNANSEFIGTFAIFADISDLKNAEDEVRFLLDLLLHDIGNQLQLILAGADMLTSDSTKKQIENAKRYVL